MPDLSKEEEAECRICRVSEEPDRPLYYPCKCSGSIKYTHQDCLVHWLEQSQSKKCELCHHSFRFEPLYRPNTPQSLPLSELVVGILARAKTTARTTARIALVMLVWMFFLPLLTCWTWHALFVGSVNELSLMVFQRGLVGVVGDILHGHLLSVVIIFIFFGVSSLREYIQNPNEDAEDIAMDQEEPVVMDAAPNNNADVYRDDANEDRNQQGADLREAANLGFGNGPADMGVGGNSEIAQAANEVESEAGTVEAAWSTEADNGTSIASLEDFPPEVDRIPVVETPRSFEDGQQDIGVPLVEDAAGTIGGEEVRDVRPYLQRELTVHEGLVIDANMGTGVRGPRRVQYNDVEIAQIQRNNREPVEIAEEVAGEFARANGLEGNIDQDGDRNGEGGPLFGLFDLDPDDVPLEEVIGLRGPIRNLFENSGTVLFSNIIFLFIFVLFPLIVGRVTFRVASIRKFSAPVMLNALPSSMSSSEARAGTRVALSPIAAENGTTEVNLSVEAIANAAEIALSSGDPRPESGVVVSTAEGQIPPIGNFFTILLGYGVISLACVFYVILNSLLKSRYPRFDSPSTRYMFRFVRCVATFLKVVLLIAFEFGVFPLGCGWWLDVCTLSFVGGTFASRVLFLRSAPWTSTLIHWLLGLVYMVNVSLFVTVLRELIQPSLLWFLRNPDDPDFHPFRELIHKPLSRHARRMVLSILIYAPLISLLVYVPCQLCTILFPGVFPFNVQFTDPLTEIPADLLLLHVSIPLTTLIQRANPRKNLVRFMKLWIWRVGIALGIHHLVARGAEEGNESNSSRGHSGQAQGYVKFVRLRGTIMILLAWLTLVITEVIVITIPTVLGRLVFRALGLPCSHDIYTFGVGAYLLVFLVEFVLHAQTFVQHHELGAAFSIIRRCLLAMTKIGAILSLSLVILPVMIGVLLELTIIVPLRVGVNESTYWFVYQDWALGLLIMMLGMRISVANEGPFRACWERIRAGGLHALDNEFEEVMGKILLPMFHMIGSFLSFPFIFVHSALPRLRVKPEWLLLGDRYIYLVTAAIALQIIVCILTRKALASLHDTIRDDKYLVGRQLYNLGATAASDSLHRSVTSASVG